VSESEKKYLINVDFPERSRIHLNPNLFELDSRCRTGPKNPSDGGAVYASEAEAQRYLALKGSLRFRGRQVTNLQTCKLCSKLSEYGLESDGP